jgi:ribosome-associated protein
LSSEETIEDLDPIWERILIASESALEKKGIDPLVLDLREHSQMADYFLILSGRSDTHARAIADSIGAGLRQHGVYPISAEGERTGHWILLDYGDFLVHVFYAPTREIYGLERLWARATQRSLPAELLATEPTLPEGPRFTEF